MTPQIASSREFRVIVLSIFGWSFAARDLRARRNVPESGLSREHPWRKSRGRVADTPQGGHDFNEVCDAIQPKIPNAGTKYGKMPYKVSLAEWEWRSTARNT